MWCGNQLLGPSIHEHWMVIYDIKLWYIYKDSWYGVVGIQAYSFSSEFFMIQGSEVTNWEVGTPSSSNLAKAAEKLGENPTVSIYRTLCAPALTP